jgi:hypothetical protein
MEVGASPAPSARFHRAVERETPDEELEAHCDPGDGFVFDDDRHGVRIELVA